MKIALVSCCIWLCCQFRVNAGASKRSMTPERYAKGIIFWTNSQTRSSRSTSPSNSTIPCQLCVVLPDCTFWQIFYNSPPPVPYTQRAEKSVHFLYLWTLVFVGRARYQLPAHSTYKRDSGPRASRPQFAKLGKIFERRGQCCEMDDECLETTFFLKFSNSKKIYFQQRLTHPLSPGPPSDTQTQGKVQ